MVHTLPDYTTKYKLAKIFGNVDNAELAARLGALSVWDRRGNILWYDDFENTAVKWGTSIAAGGSVAISNAFAWQGNGSMRLVTDVDLNDSTAIAKFFPLPIERTMGAEFYFKIDGEKPIIRLWLLGYTGTTCYQASVRYNHDTAALEYLNSAGGWTAFTNTDYNVTLIEHWFYMKLVIDFDTGKYMRFLYNSSTYDMTGVNMRSTASATRKHVEVYIYCISTTGPPSIQSIAYIDNFVLTQNEP